MSITELIAQTKAAIAEITDAKISATRVDLNNCDREPIHIPAAIQPHGALVVINEADWSIVQVSANVEAYLGKPIEALLNQPASELFELHQIQLIEQCLAANFEAINPLHFDFTSGAATRPFAGVVHRSDDNIVIELEPAEATESVNFFDFYQSVKRPISQIQRTRTLAELCQTAVTVIQAVSGFDRVMVYQLDEDGSGHVIAEAKRDDLEPYLGLHYPATDIPQQAKYLYLLNLLRLIPDASYEPVAIVPDRHPITHTPLDMSLSHLRSVSPLHTEYLANMGIQASMSISLMQNQSLWGLIACHHPQPRQLSHELRSICEFLGQVVGLELSNRQESEDVDSRLQTRALQASFVEAFAHNDSLRHVLTQDAERLLGLVNATGAVLCDQGEVTLIGQTPDKSALWPLIDWLSQQLASDVVYHTARLSDRYPPAAEFSDTSSGLLAISISQVQQIYMIWLRPEIVQTVDWAGAPHKPQEIDATGQVRMSPRKSFEKWQEVVHQAALPWQSHEIEAAVELRSMVVGLVLQKADELTQLNTQLERSNLELDSFAYVASHDLKEPLRGIHNYSSFLIEDYGDQLGQDGVDKLNTLMRLTQRMENLINSLLHYSRLGRTDLQITPVDLQALVEDVIEVIKISKPEQVNFQLPQPLPLVECDSTQVTELFTNLISNAIKYNTSDEKVIKIGCLTAAEIIRAGHVTVPAGVLPPANVFWVRDNGMGIRPKHIESVFRIFKRLHAQNRYGGGTGAGLTIVKKIVERHGGQIWIDSVYGEGSTFYFTLKGHQHD